MRGFRGKKRVLTLMSAGLCASVTATAWAVAPRAGATYSGASTVRGDFLQGSLTVARDGRSIQTMRLSYDTPSCPGGQAALTQIPAAAIPIRQGHFTITRTVRSYAVSGLRGPARTTIHGRFLPGGRSAVVFFHQVIVYPRNHVGCTRTVISVHTTMTLPGA